MKKGKKARGQKSVNKTPPAVRTLDGGQVNVTKRRVRRDRAHQLYYARRTLEKHGVDVDLFDLENLLDFSLTYSENYALVLEPILAAHSQRWQLKAMEASWARAAQAAATHPNQVKPSKALTSATE